MNKLRFATVGLVIVLAAASAAEAQTRMRIGYVYPAGGQQGATFEAVVAGQFLTGVSEVRVSGRGVQAKIVEMIRPMAGKELNELRIRIDELMARKAVVKKDFVALERFRSFKNAKNVKTDTAAHDKELEELKKKYANATWTAEDEKMLTEARKKLGGAVRRPANPAISELAVVEFTVAADAEVGQRELRIGTAETVSNPLAFCVGQLPEVSETPSKTITQQKSAVAKTAVLSKSRKTETEKEITLPAVVNGQILPGEVDRYRFTAKRGQHVVIAVSARQLIPYIADAVPGWFQATLSLYDAQGKELAYDDDFRFDPDPVLHCQIPADGQYVVEIKDAIYRGREDFVYRMTVGELPFVTNIFPLGGPAGKQTTVQLQGWNLPVRKLTVDNSRREPGLYPLSVEKDGRASNRVPFAVDCLPEVLEREPNNQPAGAQPVAMPAIVNGRINPPDDCDVFRVEGRAGSQLVAEVNARRLSSPLDSLLKLTDANGRQLALTDDSEDKGEGLITHHADSRISVSLPADGAYYLHLSDAQHKGGPEYAYRLRISPPRPDFALRVTPSNINARAGTSGPVTVYALRKDGFAGEIAVALTDVQPGFMLSGGRIPADKDQVRVTFTLPPSPPKEPFRLKLEGRATIDGREVAHAAVPAEDMIQAFEYRHLVPAQELLAAVTARGMRALGKILGETPVKIPSGGTARVRVEAPARAIARVDLRLFSPPEGITIQDVNAVDDGVEIVLHGDADKAKPGLKGNLIVVATAKKPTKPAKPPRGKKGDRNAPLATLPAIPFEVVTP